MSSASNLRLWVRRILREIALEKNRRRFRSLDEIQFERHITQAIKTYHGTLPERRTVRPRGRIRYFNRVELF